jgi:hypothetical protein
MMQWTSYPDQTECLGVPRRPFKVIQQGPCKISEQGNQGERKYEFTVLAVHNLGTGYTPQTSTLTLSKYVFRQIVCSLNLSKGKGRD